MCARSPDHPRDTHVAVYRVHVQRARGERLDEQVAVDCRERQRCLRAAIDDGDAAGDRLDRREPCRPFEREVAVDALHAHFAFDVRHPDVARHCAKVDEGIGRDLHVELDIDATPIPAFAVLHTNLDAVAGGIGFDHRIREALLCLLGIRSPRALQRLDFDPLRSAGRHLDIAGDIGKYQRCALGNGDRARKRFCRFDPAVGNAPPLALARLLARVARRHGRHGRHRELQRHHHGAGLAHRSVGR